MSYSINTANIHAYQNENARCEHCNSTTMTMQGTIYVNGSPQSIYSCANGHYTKGMTSSQQSLVANNNQNGGAITWVGTTMGNTGGLASAQVPLNTYNLEEKVRQLSAHCQQQTNEIRNLNQKFDRVARAIEILIDKIDEAKLADPLASLTNRIRNFELK